ncbi:MAG: PilZ domain-containing protein [Myxococcota bacterium]
MKHHARRTGDGEVTIWLSATDGDWRGQVAPLDLTSRGARLRQDPADPVPVPVGGEVTLWLCDGQTGVELPIAAQLVSRREEGDARILGVDFTDLRSVGGLLHPVLGRVMNRRTAFRVTPQADRPPIGVTLAAAPELDLPLEMGVLVDISTGGMAVDVPLAFEAGLGGYDRLETLFRLPGLDGSLSVSGRIVHRTLRGDRVRYGVQFTMAESPTFQDTHDAILNYVIRRQQQMAEAYELEHGTGIPAQALRSRPN